MRYNEDEEDWDFIHEALRNEEEVEGYEYCPGCYAINAYAWQDSNMDPNTGQRTYMCGIDGVLRNGAPDIYHIPTASCFDWTCGRCRTGWMPIDSPINAEVYTHNPVGYNESEDE